MMVTGKVLTFDLAAQTGYAVGEVGELRPTFATHNFASTGANIGKHQKNAREWLASLILLHKPTLIAYEAPSLFGITTPATVRKLCSYCNTLEEICEPGEIVSRTLGRIPVWEVNPSQLKKFWTGKGNAKKPDMEARARNVGFMVRNDDEADAVAMWFWIAHCYSCKATKDRVHQMLFEAGMGRAQKALF